MHEPLQGANFYRIIHNFIDQAGIYVDSVFGGQFSDDPGGLKLRHTKKVGERGGGGGGGEGSRPQLMTP